MLRKFPSRQSSFCAAAIVAVSTVGLAVIPWDAAEAQSGPKTTTLTSAPMLAASSDSAELMVSNLGRRPVVVTLILADATAEGLTPLATSEPTVLQPGSTVSLPIFTMPECRAIGIVRAAANSAQAVDGIRASFQLFDSLGATKIFTDGFESGDTAS